MYVRNDEIQKGVRTMGEIQEEIRAALFAAQDLPYRDFQGRLLPTVVPERMIGVRVPVLRKMAVRLQHTPEAAAFLCALPHTYYEENMFHALLLNPVQEYDRCMAEIQRFLPYVDNWAVCDSLRPRVLHQTGTNC